MSDDRSTTAERITAILTPPIIAAIALIAAEERAADQPPMQPTAPVDEKTQAQVNQYLLIAHKPYLTRKEASVYLGVSERSIAEWSVRPVDQNPFPEAAAGGEPRYKRERIDEWAEAEGTRRRVRAVG